jgi:uncharacterized repeat protein (TIGR03847 family)
MPPNEIDLDPTTHITIDAIGKPGQRTFYLQGWSDDQNVVLLIEKIQVQTLAVGVEQFLKEIGERFPELEPASNEYNESKMHILPPVDPLFRVGEIGLGYENDRDFVILIAKHILMDDETQDEPSPEEDISVVRFWCTRSQIWALCRWGLEVSGRGRAVCPLCGEAMDPEGHFCPKRNGHKH